MKQPVVISSWPLQEFLKWFEGKTFVDIVKKEEESFKSKLKQNTLKIITNLNKSFHDKIDAWRYLEPHKQSFGPLFKAAIRLALSNENDFKLNTNDRYQLLTFFNYAFNSIEVDFVHGQIRRYLPLSIWFNLSESRRNLELSRLSKRIRAAWSKLEQQDEKLDPQVLDERKFERTFMFNYMNQFIRILENAVTFEQTQDTEGNEIFEEHLNKDIALYCQRFIEFLIDVESQLPLRRFFHALLDYVHLTTRCQLSPLARHKSSEGHLFDQLVELLLLYSKYQLDLMTGEPYDDVEVARQHERRIFQLQKVLWSKYPQLKDYAIKPIGAVDEPTALYKIITGFESKEELFEFLQEIGLADEQNMDEDDKGNVRLMASIVMNHYKRYNSQMRKIDTIPLFPNESVIWDTNLVPDQYYNYEYPLALPKLNLQFLTMSDYLLRNFMLFKNESTYEIRQDIEDGVIRSKCRWTAEGKFATGPKQRMALVIKDFTMIEVGKPRLGENFPSKVRAKVTLNMDYVRPEWRREWEQLRKHDTCFLVSFRMPEEEDRLGWPDGTFPQRHGIKFVRGCEIESLLDSDGKVVDENSEKPSFTNNLRTYTISLDCNQYHIDEVSDINSKLKIYHKFNLIVRRRPEKNNFKGVLETIRSLIKSKFVVPHWLRDLIIGFGDPADAHYTNLRPQEDVPNLDFYDTFTDFEHLTETFRALRPDHSVDLDELQNLPPEPPFRVRMDGQAKELTVIPYKIPSRGPYPRAATRRNQIKFTPAQVEAIHSGLQPGLTMIVGPPGTGKTDVAVQILSTIYHSNPEQRTLIVTHSNQALNQIFEKMIELDVKEHHLLRMGHGEEELQSTKDFSRQGRIRYVLTRRLELLAEACKLARSLGLDPGDGLSCQSAEYFNSYHIESRWSDFLRLAEATDEVGEISGKFPFTKFFADAPQPLFKGESKDEDLEIAKGCYRHIEEMFATLRAFRPFEIFSSAAERSKYLLIREAKIIAMTCTHAGLRRKELVEMNFQYDNILMEETAQILEIETTIPLLLQNPENGVNRLKRWIMIGDHNQLPPIIQNSAFQKFSNMEQSLFSRFIRLGVPAIELDKQGRARSSLCDLYRWRYSKLEELEHVHQRDEFRRANGGFVFDYQLINVNDYQGSGEQTPMAHFYQNRGEAEYLVALYKYMLMIGYPSDKITILTTYNGQLELLRELIDQHCNQDAYLEAPNQISTVDKYQGQQNDYILLSLVRSRSVGHVRDIRRLVVAMSRARLGLYVFGRVCLFRECFELRHSMELFTSRPQELCLLSDERFPTKRLASEPPTDASQWLVVKSVEEMQQLVERRYGAFVQSRRQLLDTEEQQDEGAAEGQEVEQSEPVT